MLYVIFNYHSWYLLGSLKRPMSVGKKYLNTITKILIHSLCENSTQNM